MKRNVMLVILGIAIIGSCNAAKLSDVLNLKRGDYILRSCIASAQLTRRLSTNGVSQLTSIENPILSEPQSDALLLNNVENKNLIKRSRSNTKAHPRLKARYLVNKNIDTPLGTVDVKTLRKDIPKVFKKKERLPELDSRRGAARNIDTEADIILVQPLKH
ncbi:uncharacterized protein LOC131664924 isoform X1 [Phymastichus coffea]|uniref:uncharacterized protein LOC131664924 isoform X1 n=1 Tax=Phymastichus coffea TaxID=108790 RepID=UPI00273AC00A|nr:uncharacterized protein LOC131664924 isoform X1 [Phymastichus coffea]